MKKKMLNDKTIRAIAIGLSAMIATTQPMTAFAAEEGEAPAGTTEKVEVKPSAEQEVKNAVEKDKTVDKAVAQVENVDKAADEYKEVSGLDTQKDSLANIDSNVSNLESNMNAADKDMSDAAINLGKVQEANETISDEKSNADDIVESLTENAANIYSTVKDAKDKSESYDEEIKNSTTIAAATTAYENIVAEAAKAEEEYEKAEEKYNDLMEEYEAALLKVSAAIEAYNTALNDGKGNIDDAASKLAEAEKNADAIKTEAVNVKEAAKAERERLKDAADEAYNKLVEELKATRKKEQADADDTYHNAIAEIDKTHEAAKDAAADAHEKARADIYSDYSDKKAELGTTLSDAKKAATKEYNKTVAAAEADTNKAIDAINNSEKAKLLKDIEAQKKLVNDIKDGTKSGGYYLAADELVILLVKNSLYDNEDVDTDSISMSTWTRGQGDANNVEVTYKLKGSDEVITEYFDYVTCDENGNTINGYVDASQIKVVKKTPVLKSGNGDVITVESSEAGDIYKVNGSELKDNQTAKVNADGTITVVTTELDRTDVSYKNGESEITVQVDNKNKTMYKVDGKPLNDNANVKYEVTGNATDGYTVTKSEYKDVDFHYEYNVKDLYLTVDKKGKVSIAKQESWDSFIPVSYKNVKWDEEKKQYTADVLGWYKIGWEYKEFTFAATDKTRKQKEWVDTTTVYSKVETPVYKDSEETFKNGFVAKGDDYYTNTNLSDSISSFKKQITDLEEALEAEKKAAADARDEKKAQAQRTYDSELADLISQRDAKYAEADGVYDEAIATAKTACTNAKTAAGEARTTARNEAESKYQADKTKAGEARDLAKSEATNSYNDQHAYYENLYKQASTQISRVQKAETAVEKIQTQLAALSPDAFEESEYGDYASLKIWYESRLNAAKADLDNAKKALDDILEDVETAKADLDDTIRRLTPVERRRGNNNTSPVAAEVVNEDVLFVNDGTLNAAFVQAPVQMAQAGVQVAQVNGNAQANGDVINLDAAQTPLADFAEEVQPSDANAITLEDEATPLVDFAEKENMNWWWLIVVAVLGATGVALYRKHQLKKAKAESVKEK